MPRLAATSVSDRQTKPPARDIPRSGCKFGRDRERERREREGECSLFMVIHENTQFEVETFSFERTAAPNIAKAELLEDIWKG